MTTLERLCTLLTRETGVTLAPADADRKLVDLGIDSLTYNEALFWVEREFKVRIDTAELRGIDTLARLAQLLDERAPRANAGP